MVGNTLLQVIMAIIVVLLLGVISYSIYNNDIRTNLYNMSSKKITKKQVPVCKGIYSYTNSKVSYNTNNPELGDYVALDPSINQTGGAEYSYNFWLYKTAECTTTPLFIRGSDKKVSYDSNKYNCKSDEGWYLVKNPLVTLLKDDETGDHGLVVELNSLREPDGYKLNASKPNCSSLNDLIKYESFIGIKNMNASYNEKWTMITLVVQETNPSSDIIFRNKANVKFYVNGILHVEKSVGNDDNGSTAMLHNHGKLHINPESESEQDDTTKKTMIADLLYSNYVLTIDEITALYKAKFTTTGMVAPTYDKINETEFKYSSIIDNPDDIKITAL
jgi:hypothetical protein